MSRLAKLSIRGKGSKVKPQPEAETKFNKSGSSATAVGGVHGSTPPQFASSDTRMVSPGSQASGSFMTSPGSLPSSLMSREVLSPDVDSTDGGFETLSKAEMKKLAGKKWKAEKKEKEAERKAEEKRLKAERMAEKERKADAKFPLDENLTFGEDLLGSSTLVSTAIPGAAADLSLRQRSEGWSELVVKSKHEAGHRGEMNTAVNLPNSIGMERLQKSVRGFQQLQPYKEQELQDKTEEVEKLSEAVAKREQRIEDLYAQIEDLYERVRDLNAMVEEQCRKLEERERQINALRKVAKLSALNQKSHFEQVVKLTEQVSEYEEEMRKQKHEITRLKKFEGHIDEFEQQILRGGSQLSEKEEEIKSKDDKIRRLQHDLQGGAAGAQVQAYEDEVDKLRPLETDVTQLRDKLKKSESEQLKPLKDECAQLKTDLEASQRDVVVLKAELAQREAQQSCIEAEEMQKQHHTVKSAKGIITDQNLLHGHSKEQSRAVFRLQQQLETMESEERNLEEVHVQYGEAVAKLEQAREELKQVKEERDSALVEARQLQQDLTTTERESKKELKRVKAKEKFEQELREVSLLQKAREELKQKSEEVAEANTNIIRLQDEVLVKTQQVKRYKKQVDGCKGQVGEMKAEMEGLKTELGVYQEQVMQHREQFGKKDELAPFVVQPSKMPTSMEAKGRGSFGTVHVIEVSGIPCIAKRLHDILVGRGGEEVVGRQNQSLLDKFRKECVLLSQLRHPNIVQFMGVHYGRDPSDLTLIMECLRMDLEECLETYHDIPLPLKLSILLDASYGLLHLHSQTPPIIHRDLSAANILLSASMTAKIADLGVSKYLDSQKQTKAPGAYAYMPPEAVNPEPSYNTKLDNFSFGAVALYVATQKFPQLDDNSITVEAVQKHEIQIQKRIVWIQKMGDHCLRPLIIQCLQDLPKKRPATAKINEDLKQLSQQFPRKFQDVLKMQKQLEHLECETQKLLQEQAGMEMKIRQRISQEILQGSPS